MFNGTYGCREQKPERRNWARVVIFPPYLSEWWKVLSALQHIKSSFSPVLCCFTLKNVLKWPIPVKWNRWKTSRWNNMAKVKLCVCWIIYGSCLCVCEKQEKRAHKLHLNTCLHPNLWFDFIPCDTFRYTFRSLLLICHLSTAVCVCS